MSKEIEMNEIYFCVSVLFENIFQLIVIDNN